MAIVKMVNKYLLLASFASILQKGFSAVEDCPPCDPGKYCSKFFGVCLVCSEYCPGGSNCPAECSAADISTPLVTTTISTTTTTTVYTTYQPPISNSSDITFSLSSNTKGPSGVANTNGDEYLILSAELVFGLLISLCFTLLLTCLCRKYYKTLKIPEICCFFRRGDSNNRDIELRVIQRRTSGTYSAVQVEDVDGIPDPDQPGPSRQRALRPQRPSREATASPAYSTPGCQEYPEDDIPDPEQPGPPRQRPSREAPAAHAQFTTGCQETPEDGILDPEEPGPSRQTARRSQRPSRETTAAPAQSTSGSIYQSASVSQSAPILEFERNQQARPTTYRSPPPEKTPETLRKITDGTYGKVSIGASIFDPPSDMVEDIQRKRQSGHGD
ncbi:uncharacterized protein LOC129270584 isoform X2 [Lytechinus pictus]